ncbi:ATP-grasp domain protein [Mycobacterium xenopi 3993]|nr:ATP-grasp domain protein [Mycobacterium xenopi 3993]
MMMDEETQALAREAGLEVMHPPVELRHRLSSKLVMTRLADEAGVQSVPHVIGRVGSYDELRALAHQAGLGDDLVVVAAYGDAGSAVFFVRGQRDWDEHAGDLAGQEVKVMKRIRNVEVCIEGTVTRHGTVIGPAMTSLVGYPELTPRKGGWCGNDIWREVLPPAQTHAARQMVGKLGDILSREGYRGYFEVDLLHDLDSDELYLGEVNPRLSGASPMTNLTTEAYADMPLFLFHLLEYMDVDYELDIDAINARWERGYGEDEVWGQVILSETSHDVEIFTATPRTGVWRIDDDGRVTFARPANDWATLLDGSEAFYMRVAAPGDLRCEGHNSACSSPAGTCRPTTTSSLSVAGAGSRASGRSSPRLPWPRPRRSSRGSLREREHPRRHLTRQLALTALRAVVLSARRRFRTDCGNLTRDRAGRGVARGDLSPGRHPNDRHRWDSHHRGRGDGRHRYRRVGRCLARLDGGRGVRRQPSATDPSLVVLGQQVAGGSRRRRAAGGRCDRVRRAGHGIRSRPERLRLRGCDGAPPAGHEVGHRLLRGLRRPGRRDTSPRPGDGVGAQEQPGRPVDAATIPADLATEVGPRRPVRVSLV